MIFASQRVEHGATVPVADGLIQMALPRSQAFSCGPAVCDRLVVHASSAE